MATTRLMPLHTGKGRTVGQAISAIIDYTENPQKTDGGRLITSWQCDSRIADAEFLFAKNQYTQKTGRVRGEDDVIAYHLRQSFVPGDGRCFRLNYQSSGTKTSFPRPHIGHNQSSGKSSNAVPGAIPLSGSPTSGSYS